MTRRLFAGGLLLAALAVTPPLTFAQTATTPTGRLLASNCFQCHGTDGRGGFEKLAGMSASELIGELREMRQESPPEMMDAHAHGYTDEQIRLIADYFSKLPR